MAFDRDRLTDLYHAALTRAPEERSAFLKDACDGDERLRQEVESLLRYEPDNAPFLETPAMLVGSDPARSPDSSPMIGRQLGPYTIVGPLGSGGMGEVYRARDGKLGRDVAIKILPSHFTADPERRARFAREARLLATLNHPHIGAIYGLEESDGVTALALELVEGPTLADRLERGPLPMAEALTIARQVAEALDAAHEKGIVHRDLKPANVVLQSAANRAGVSSGDVRAKVLDFGLAKTMAVGLSGDLTRAPSGSLDSTAEGRILGTPAYMSPEQARGQAVDKRTDVWAFGCVLFEMLTGRRAFDGDTVTDTLVRVLEREPEWTELPAATPEPVRKLLRRCLEKDPWRRVRDIGDARLELDEGPDRPPQPPTLRGRRWWALGLAALLIAAIGVSSGRLLTRSVPARVLRPQQLTDLVGLEETPALSPEGLVAFTAAVNGKRQVFVQSLEAGGNPLQITSDDADHQFPRWMPGSGSIVYFSPATQGASQGTLHEISALGGDSPRTVVNSMGGADVRMADRRLTYFRLAEGKIELVTAYIDGSSVHVVKAFDAFDLTRGSLQYMFPRWSPDGERIAYQAGRDAREIHIVASGGGEPAILATGTGNQILSGLAWLPDGSGLVFSSSRDDTMLYLPTARLWHVNLEDEMRPLTSGEVSYLHPDVGANGMVVVSRLDLKSNIFAFPTDGTPQTNTQKGVQLTFQTGRVVTPTAGPGDREVAFVWDRGGHANIWAIDVASRKLRQITNERDPSVAVGVPVWSPTGRSIAYVSTKNPSGASARETGIWLVNSDGSGVRTLVSPGIAPAWAPDGNSVYFTDRERVGLFKIPAEGGQQTTVRPDMFRNLIGSHGTTVYMLVERRLVDGLPVLQIGAAEPEDGPFRLLAEVSQSRVPRWQTLNPTLSPDGKWIAMPLVDGLSTNIWTLSTSTGVWRQITDFGRPTFIARRVSWSWDGRSVLAAVAEGDADIFRLDGLLPGGRH